MIFGIFVLLKVIMCVVISDCNTTTTIKTSVKTSVKTTSITKVTKTLTVSKVKPTETRTSSKMLNPTRTPKTTKGNIPVSSGNSATLTYFTDTVFQCTNEKIPEYAVAVNPLLLGFTLDDWNNKYSGVNSKDIPWCGKMINITVNGKMFNGRIIDTCNPSDSGGFIDPNTGKMIGGKCDYDNVIDLYGETGRTFLQDTVGDDFYQGDLEWEIV